MSNAALQQLLRLILRRQRRNTGDVGFCEGSEFAWQNLNRGTRPRPAARAGSYQIRRARNQYSPEYESDPYQHDHGPGPAGSLAVWNRISRRDSSLRRRAVEVVQLNARVLLQSRSRFDLRYQPARLLAIADSIRDINLASAFQREAEHIPI